MNEKAFPLWTGHSNNKDTSTGMDLRDYFAAKALQGLCANSQLEKETVLFELTTGSKKIDSIIVLSKLAYAFADKMMEVRQMKEVRKQ
jgi:hypothetical protein